MRIILVLVMLIAFAPGTARAWSEPARGSATRSALMDAIRPHAEWMLGTPVEFVVHELRVAGPLAFASLWPQRPGGGQIDLRTTPAYYRNEIHPDDMDGIGMQALYYRSGQTWVAVHWAMGATDVWYAYEPICAVWRPVIPEACQGM